MVLAMLLLFALALGPDLAAEARRVPPRERLDCVELTRVRRRRDAKVAGGSRVAARDAKKGFLRVAVDERMRSSLPLLLLLAAAVTCACSSAS